MKPPMPAETHVVIAGAGIAGMAAAMILAEAGVRVTLCEAAPEAGGKAKSLRLPDGHPTEHSLRVYMDNYQTLLALFSRIPTENGMTVLDNLVGVSPVRVYRDRSFGRAAAPVPLQRRRPTFPRIVGKVLEPLHQLGLIALRSAMVFVGMASRGVSPIDAIHYLYAHLRLLWMCKERLVEELGDISYADYLRLSRKSSDVQSFFTALPRIFVAARPSAEAAAIAPVILKGLFHFTSRPPALNGVKAHSIMMMNGPTSERMIDPWIRHLQSLGVDIHFDTRVNDLEFDNGRITALTSADGRRFECDYAILALPYLTLREMAKSGHVRQHLPHLAAEHAIELESSNGIQCFLRDIPATWPSFVRPGVVGTYFESEWALISVLQGDGFWKNARLPEGTKYVLSMTWSEVDKPGPVFHRPASECTPAEILTECLAQCGLDESHILGWQIDHELKYLSEAEYQSRASELPPHLALAPSRGMRMLNLSPLAILLPGARRRSPCIHTEVPNLFLAGEAIYSPELTLFVPTMEKAATSGYLAAHDIIGVAAPHAAPGLRIHFQDLVPFSVLRRVDRWLWSRRRPKAPARVGGYPSPSHVATGAPPAGVDAP
ncbi:hydroxysqualene dehydroxylase [Mycobacterium lacus]|uniref:Oxidoreductase n=1 Tax=Mycobacterium lacus TaxID=169765 RepID=A0A7I7NS53_9MYCO|nr:FAD-dependent oxidoreductase [Mycobacterium lacus]MCV7124638.1 FAD-dependent oxidoreductase [Mycobacterium lacus]BBX99238.1 oxidoreductase [Mycobacterium lacus]